MNNRRQWFLYPVIGALLLLGLFGVTAAAKVNDDPPPFPHKFYGALTVGGQDAAALREVEATGVGVYPDTSHNPLVTQDAGQYGVADPISPRKLTVQGDWETIDEPLEFYVDGVRAETGTTCQGSEDTYCYDPGEITQLDLNIPAYTLTVTATGCAPVSVVYTPSVPIVGGGGMVTDTVAGETKLFTDIPRDTAVQLTADVSDPCCGFDSWLVDGTETITQATTVITMTNSDRTVEATSSARARLEASFLSPSEGATFSVGQEFDVTAEISNTCSAGDALSVTAELSMTAGVDLVTGSLIQDLDGLAGGQGQVVTWTLMGTSAGVADLTVSPDGVDKNTGVAIVPENLISDSRSITVQTPAALQVAVDAPSGVPVGEQFVVTGTVENTGQADADGVTAVLTYTAGAELAAGSPSVDIGLLPGGPSEVITWTLDCTAPQAVTVTVSAEGVDANSLDSVTDEASQVVNQQAPDIEVTPSELAVTLGVDEAVTDTLTIGNVGDADLTWSLAESPAADWLDETPTSGTVAPSDSGEVIASFDAAGLTAGETYTTTLTFTSNDPDEGTVEVPVTLTVEQYTIFLPLVAKNYTAP